MGYAIIFSSVLLLQGISVSSSISLNVSKSYEIYDTNSTDLLEYVLLGEKNLCKRTCVKGLPPMTCKYTFTLEWYHTMSKACFECPFNPGDCLRSDCIAGDGSKRGVVVINRQMPGPSIEVCLGDEVVVDVENRLGTESTTVHWHGLHQRNTPYMDGVPHVTQCPIAPASTFRYHFRALNAGTHFWHSHSGFQRADGAFGPFIVRIPEEDNAHAEFYDYDLSEHVIVLLDWGEEMGLEKFLAHHHNDGDNKPVTLLVNGLGIFNNFSKDNYSVVNIPPKRFTVEQGYRYRFRVINAGFLNCPIEVSVDNHTLTMISSDGNDFSSIKAESFVTYAGERFDFILNADQPKDLYWMRFKGLMDCSEKFTSAHQVAVLQYDNCDNYTALPERPANYSNAHKSGLQVNSLNKGTESNSSNHVPLPKLKSLSKWDQSLKKIPDFQYYVSYDFYKIDNPHFHKMPYYGFKNVTNKKQQLLTPQLNRITMKFLSFPLLSQRHQLQDNMFCNETTVRSCDVEFCECTHVVQVPLNNVVEMVLIDKGVAFDANHPFHLHGNSFRVVAMERLGTNTTLEEVLHKDQTGGIKRNLVDAPIKDTVTVPDGGYTVIRFLSSNPGYWLFHCHIEFHAEIGMALVFKVGNDNEMPPVPKGFPTCGDFIPEPRTDNIDCDNSNRVIGEFRDVFPSFFEKHCTESNKTDIINPSVVIIMYAVIYNIFRWLD